MWNFKINVSLLRKTILKLKTFQQLQLTLRGRWKEGLMIFSWNVLFKNLQEYIIDLACTFCLKNPLKWMTKCGIIKHCSFELLKTWTDQMDHICHQRVKRYDCRSSPHNPLCAPAWPCFCVYNLKIDFVTFQQKCTLYKQLWNILTINQFKSLSKKNMFLRFWEKIPARKNPPF